MHSSMISVLPTTTKQNNILMAAISKKSKMSARWLVIYNDRADPVSSVHFIVLSLVSVVLVQESVMKAAYRKCIPSKTVKRPPGSSWSRENDNVDIVVIRNMDPSTDFSTISYDLGCLGYRVIGIKVATNCWTKKAVPLYFIKLEKNPWNESIFNVRYLAHQVIQVEKYVPNPELPRCTNCQGLDHLMDECNKPSICAWCSGHHPTKKCYMGKDFPPTCSRCRGTHPSNYKGCQIYRRQIHKTKDMQALANNEAEMSKSSKKDKQKLSQTKHQESKLTPKLQKPEINRKMSLSLNVSHEGHSPSDASTNKQELSQRKHQESKVVPKLQTPEINRKMSLTQNFSPEGPSPSDASTDKQELSQRKHQDSKVIPKHQTPEINHKMSLTPNFFPEASSSGGDSTVRQESSQTKHQELRKVGLKLHKCSIDKKMSPTPNISPEGSSTGDGSIKKDENCSSVSNNSSSQEECIVHSNPINSAVTFFQHYLSMNKDLRVMIFSEKERI